MTEKDHAKDQQRDLRKDHLRTLDEILPALGLTKYNYWQLKYRGANLPQEEGYAQTGRGRPMNLYDPEKVIAAVTEYRNRAATVRHGPQPVIEKVRIVLTSGPKTRKEIEDALGAVTENQRGGVNKALNDLEDRRIVERQSVMGSADKYALKGRGS
jgi:hypothetical protein